MYFLLVFLLSCVLVYCPVFCQAVLALCNKLILPKLLCRLGNAGDSGGISQFVLQADHHAVGLHVRHMSKDYMNICAVFMLKI